MSFFRPLSAVGTAQAFVTALAWGEHTTVWELLAPRARLAVLDLATRRGMDPLLSARLREDTAGPEERDEFLADLLAGLRTELRGVDVDAVRCVKVDAKPTVEGAVVVQLVIDVPAELGSPVPVGRVEVALSVGQWSVLRLDSMR